MGMTKDVFDEYGNYKYPNYSNSQYTNYATAIGGKMGMSIDEARTALGKERKYALHENKQAFDIAIDVMCKYQMMQADYNARLKASMVAMLTELHQEIEEKATELCDDGWWLTYNDLIQEKINSLKGEV